MAASLLVPRNYKIYRRIIQPVKQRQNHPARIAKHCIDTQFNKRIDNYLGACFDSGFVSRTGRTRLGTHFFKPFLINLYIVIPVNYSSAGPLREANCLFQKQPDCPKLNTLL
jgi:hypothetical protein